MLEFNSSASGQRAATKQIEQLYKKRKEHPWFFLLKEITIVNDKLSNKRLGLRCKKRTELEIELKILNEQRNDFLSIVGVNGPPKPLNVEITQW